MLAYNFLFFILFTTDGKNSLYHLLLMHHTPILIKGEGRKINKKLQVTVPTVVGVENAEEYEEVEVAKQGRKGKNDNSKHQNYCV